MPPSQWTTVQALFQAALDLASEQREQFLSSACSDAGIREEVRSLLQCVREDDFLNVPALEGGRGVIESASNSAGTALLVNAADSHRDFIGEIAGNRYRLVRMLARGAHGVVFLAADQRLSERHVVVKILDGAVEHQRWLQRRFRQEIEILAKISHPGVAGVRDCGEIRGQPYLVMDFVEGVTLREYMKRGLAADEVAGIIAQIGSALRAAHVQGVVHRDLKPENIMVHPGGDAKPAEVRVKLIDFGIAQMHRAESGGTTTVLMIAGTARYMAPEQFLGIAEAASDIYALAVVCFEMLSGATPYPASDALTVAGAQRSTPPETILERTASIPFHVKPLLAPALAVAPERRPSDAEAFGGALRQALLQPAPGRIALLRAKVLRTAQYRVLAASFVILLAAAVLAGMAWLRTSANMQTVVTATGVNDPLSEGFSTHLDVAGTVELTGDGTGVDAWSMLTHSQGFYYHKLERRQMRAAMKRGWRLTSSARLSQGGLYLGADFDRDGPRFATGTTLDGGALVLRAWTNQTTSEFESLSSQIPGDPRGYHAYELLFDPKMQSLTVKVDGTARIHGYMGLRQFQDNLGLAFGVHRWNSPTAQAAFRSVSFEIAP